jgi:cytochrome c biogenesis protein CcmG, thiol:disulfide interchange protein DsbE
MSRNWVYLLPVVLLAVLVVAFDIGLRRDPDLLPSPLVGRSAPSFTLPPLTAGQPGFSSADLEGHVSLVNAFASWCGPCRAEQPALIALARTGQVHIYGIDYKDKPEVAEAWIASTGDPYDRIGADSDGRVGIDWGVYGVPETFLVDPKGRVRYKHVGPLTDTDINDQILPLVARLER